MRDKMETRKFRKEYVGVNLSELAKCFPPLIDTFHRMAVQLVHYADFLKELLRLSPIEIKERGINIPEFVSQGMCLGLLIESLRKHFDDLFAKYDDLRDIGKAEEGAKMLDFLSRLRCLYLLTNLLSGYFDAENSDRIKMLRNLKGKKKTKPKGEKRRKRG